IFLNIQKKVFNKSIFGTAPKLYLTMPLQTQHHIKNVLITGGTGFIGSNIAEVLLKEGCQVRILRRENSDLRALKGLNVEHFIGDILDKDSLRQAMEGCDTVFHTAAIVAMWRKKGTEQRDVNVLGTKNVAEVALESGVKKFIHTSSIAALGYRTDGKLSDETTVFNWNSNLTYKYSKHLAELEIFKAIEKGLPAVIVNPAIVIGLKDYRFHGGSLIRRVSSGMVPFYIDGGMNIVYIDDVVFGHIQAAKVGKIGERYVLGGSNLTIQEAFKQVAEVVGVSSPKFKAPTLLVKWAAKIFDSISSVTGNKPLISSDLIASIGINFWFSSEKAERELGYKITPFNEAVKKTYEWYKDEGLLE
ncbi:MAG: SDR family oxidoreductase, partial [Bacteroidota bacterium]|nr:SDR family oxidoreductase [Bacteroidota bacterium]